MSRDTFEWYQDSEKSRVRWENGKRKNKVLNYIFSFQNFLYIIGNNAVRLIGEGSIVIHSTAEFKCSSIGKEKIFGFMYKSKNSLVNLYIKGIHKKVQKPKCG